MPRDAPNRNYRDPNHKPELLCALTAVRRAVRLPPGAGDARACWHDARRRPSSRSSPTRCAGPTRCAPRSPRCSAPDDPATWPPRSASARSDARRAAARRRARRRDDFPGDVGVVLALLLNYVRLEPGEAIFLGAGNVHAYLRGTGVEIMANSDNVLRCGLTGKHVDVAELLAVTDFAEPDDPRWPAAAAVRRPRARLPAHPVRSRRRGWRWTTPARASCSAPRERSRSGGCRSRPGMRAFVPAGTPTTITGVGAGVRGRRRRV